VSLPDCEVVAIAELRPKLAQRVAAAYGVPHVYPSHRELLAKEKVDAILNIQGFTFHGRLLPELFAANLPMLTEKPLAGSVEVGRKLVAALRGTKANYLVAYHKRSDPAVMWAKRKIAEWQANGEVGPMRYIRITMPPGDWVGAGFSHLLTTDEHVNGLEQDPRPADMDEPTYKHYVGLVNYYIHQVNLMRHQLGADYHATYADANARVLIGRGEGAAAGVTCTIEMAPYQTYTAWQEEALVCFERGWIKIELPRPLAVDEAGRATCYTDKGKGQEATTLVPEMPKVHAMRQQAMNFVKAVRGEATPLCTAADALKDLEVMREYQELYVKAGGKVG
jgi:predicted dehydrogenase